MEGRREGLAAKRSVTCWVCNWWAEKSTAFCLLPVTLHPLRSHSHHSVLRGGLKVFSVLAKHFKMHWQIKHTLKCMSADLRKMSPAYDCVEVMNSQVVSEKFFKVLFPQVQIVPHQITFCNNNIYTWLQMFFIPFLTCIWYEYISFLTHFVAVVVLQHLLSCTVVG